MQKLFFTIGLLCSFLLGAQAQRMNVIKSPQALPNQSDGRLKVFLGGSIDMGKTENWQAELEKSFANQSVILLNPRRDDWNKEWKSVRTDANFRAQVEWELSALEAADIIVMYFAPGSQSPISLLEMGLYARTKKLMIVCPDGFWRKGNVDIVAERYHIDTYPTLAAMSSALQARLSK
jgi:hypothetical protein